MLILLSIQLKAQEQYAFIETNFEHDGETYDYHFEINGIEINPSKSVYKIPLSLNGFDSLTFIFNNKKQISLLKMQSRKEYVLQWNPCSMYVLYPSEKAMQGMVKFQIQSQDTTHFTVGVNALCDRIINKDSEDTYYYSPPSGNCRYSAKTIFIKSQQTNTKQHLLYHFLHGELLTVIYHTERDSIEIIMDGHVQSSAEYRYIYDEKID